MKKDIPMPAPMIVDIADSRLAASAYEPQSAEELAHAQFPPLTWIWRPFLAAAASTAPSWSFSIRSPLFSPLAPTIPLGCYAPL